MCPIGLKGRYLAGLPVLFSRWYWVYGDIACVYLWFAPLSSLKLLCFYCCRMLFQFLVTPFVMPLRCTIKVCLKTAVSLYLDWGISEIDSVPRIRAPQLFPIDKAITMYLNTFLQAFNRLGLTQWEGIEEDIAWGHVTSLMGLARPSIDGPILIYRAPIQLGMQSPSRVQLMVTTGSSPEPLLSAIASHFADLADPAQCEPWRLISIDTSRGNVKESGASPPLLHAGGLPCFSLFWSLPTRCH